LYRLVDELYERVKGNWEERFERSYGFWRGLVDELVLAFQACGDFEGGFARVYCDQCHSDYLVAYSCSRRVLCPSCAAKRAAIFGALLREEILEATACGILRSDRDAVMDREAGVLPRQQQLDALLA
jgi:hypothetical protein